MGARVLAGLVGTVAMLGVIPFAILPAVALSAGFSNECLFDGGQPDCYDTSERALLIGWGVCGLGALVSIGYVGGAGLHFAFTDRSAPYVGRVLVAGLVLLFITVVPFLFA